MAAKLDSKLALRMYAAQPAIAAAALYYQRENWYKFTGLPEVSGDLERALTAANLVWAGGLFGASKWENASFQRRAVQYALFSWLHLFLFAAYSFFIEGSTTAQNVQYGILTAALVNIGIGAFVAYGNGAARPKAGNVSNQKMHCGLRAVYIIMFGKYLDIMLLHNGFEGAINSFFAPLLNAVPVVPQAVPAGLDALFGSSANCLTILFILTATLGAGLTAVAAARAENSAAKLVLQYSMAAIILAACLNSHLVAGGEHWWSAGKLMTYGPVFVVAALEEATYGSDGPSQVALRFFTVLFLVQGYASYAHGANSLFPVDFGSDKTAQVMRGLYMYLAAIGLAHVSRKGAAARKHFFAHISVLVHLATVGMFLKSGLVATVQERAVRTVVVTYFAVVHDDDSKLPSAEQALELLCPAFWIRKFKAVTGGNKKGAAKISRKSVSRSRSRR